MFSLRFDEALAFAHHLHRTQTRKTSGVPYISHPLSVAALVIDYGGTEEEAIAALLHDSLEDQSHDYPGGRDQLAADIAGRFGEEVLRIVEGCTERSNPEEAGIKDKRERWRVHRIGYLRQVLAAGPSACLVSCADSLHNVRSLIKDFRQTGPSIWARFLTRSAEDQIWVYATSADTYRACQTGAIAEELAETVKALEGLVSQNAPTPNWP